MNNHPVIDVFTWFVYLLFRKEENFTFCFYCYSTLYRKGVKNFLERLWTNNFPTLLNDWESLFTVTGSGQRRIYDYVYRIPLEVSQVQVI